MMNGKFTQLREKYKSFRYNDFHIERDADGILLTFDFSIDGLCEFHPTTRIRTKNLNILNAFDGYTGRKIVFSLGMVEAVSYWKSACPPEMEVRCGCLSEEDCLWWKKLYYNGLGEFFYRNSVETDFDSFVAIKALREKETDEKSVFVSSGKNIIPVGGGKDSDVTMSLLRSVKDSNMCFTVNDQGARTESALAAGYTDKDTIRTFRTIDRELLRLNSENFLNGHTPFSAIVAFLSLYCAYLTGAESIVLSNEASANESNIDGTDINHQYSKSYEFECDFNSYVKNHFNINTRYFSILRGFNELQIAKYFASQKQFHGVFKSCNAGSKKNIWCCHCAKCLFVYIILSPFLTTAELVKIFGCNMLDKEEMLEDFRGLTGLSGVKPFECIGTVSEVCCALQMTARKFRNSGEEYPFLLSYYIDNTGIENACEKELLREFNRENNIPESFMPHITEMYNYVSADD